MKKVFILVIISLWLIWCQNNTEEIVENKLPDFSEIRSVCKSECEVDKQKYCLEQKTFLNPSYLEVSWTCRTISKYNKSFWKCEWFCKEFWKNKNLCLNWDWSINKGCN